MDYLLDELRPGEKTVPYTAEERRRIAIKDRKLFRHSHARFNYTTCDIRRGQDNISMRTARADVMVASGNVDHPFWYGRVVGIFHALVKDLDKPESDWQRIDFLWVWWFSKDFTHLGCFKKGRLDRLQFLGSDGKPRFGFIHPSDVIRACHIIPAFAHGRSDKSLRGPWRRIRVAIGHFTMLIGAPSTLQPPPGSDSTLHQLCGSRHVHAVSGLRSGASRATHAYEI